MGINGGIGAWADAMGDYAAHIQEWLTQAHKFFQRYDAETAEKGLDRPSLVARFDKICQIDPRYNIDTGIITHHDVPDMGRQFAILKLALAHGCQFELHIDANGWLEWMMGDTGYRLVVEPDKHLTKDELSDIRAAELLKSVELGGKHAKPKGR